MCTTAERPSTVWMDPVERGHMRTEGKWMKQQLRNGKQWRNIRKTHKDKQIVIYTCIWTIYYISLSQVITIENFQNNWAKIFFWLNEIYRSLQSAKIWHYQITISKLHLWYMVLQSLIIGFIISTRPKTTFPLVVMVDVPYLLMCGWFLLAIVSFRSL